MLYTFTPNPAIDVNVTTDSIAANTVNRTKHMTITPNGKGLNVSFVCRHFGLPNGIIGYFGGFTGEYIAAHCQKNQYPLATVPIDDVTRINYFVSTPLGEYKFVNEGPPVPAEKQDQLLSRIAARDDLSILSIHGSSANGQSADFYDRLLQLCNTKRIPVILDISSVQLKNLLKYRPLLIKPNDDELFDIFGFRAESEADAIRALQSLHAMGAQNILLTMGAKGAYFFDGSHIYFCGAKPVKLKSSACAGDAFLAGFLSIWLNDPDNVEQALKRASAAGACTAESDGLGDFSKVPAYTEAICIKKIQ